MKFPNYIRTLEDDLSDLEQTDSSNPLLALSKTITEGALAFDHSRLSSLGVPFAFSGIDRDPQNPVFIFDNAIAGYDYVDDAEYPLEYGESWNEGRRATHTGLHYKLDRTDKRPVNPYMNTGLTGRGVLGHYGPNHAVDVGAIVIRPDENGLPAAYALGITRKYDNDAKAFSGGFLKYPENEGGGYSLDVDTLNQSRTEEFFEEVISGSVTLLPDYQKRLEDRLVEGMSEEQKSQAEVEVKLEQVRELDIEFLQRLHDFLAQGRECFAGPVLNDPRNTNQAWIESHLSWVLLTDEKWNEIRGSNPKFDYRFSAGDDASGVVYHKLDRTIAEQAYASHGPMFAFMSASFLADCARNNVDLAPSIINQFEDMADFLSDIDQAYTPENLPDLCPKSLMPRPL